MKFKKNENISFINLNKNNNEINTNDLYKTKEKKLNLTNKSINKNNNEIFQDIIHNLKTIHVLKNTYINKSKQIIDIKLLKIKKSKQEKIKTIYENYNYIIGTLENEKKFYSKYKNKIENQYILKIKHNNNVNKNIEKFKQLKTNLINKIIKYKILLKTFQQNNDIKEINDLINFSNNFIFNENYVSSSGNNPKNINKIKIFKTHNNNLN